MITVSHFFATWHRNWQSKSKHVCNLHLHYLSRVVRTGNGFLPQLSTADSSLSTSAPPFFVQIATPIAPALRRWLIKPVLSRRVVLLLMLCKRGHASFYFNSKAFTRSNNFLFLIFMAITCCIYYRNSLRDQ